MNNSELKDALHETQSDTSGMVEILAEDFDEVAGGSCGSFTCGLFRVAD